MPLVGKDLIVFHIAVPAEHLVELVLDLGACVLQTVGAGSMGNGPELAFDRNVSVFIRQEPAFNSAIVYPDGIAADFLVRNGLQAGKMVLLAGMG